MIHQILGLDLIVNCLLGVLGDLGGSIVVLVFLAPWRLGG
jgi:hypothetical protein